MLLVDSNNAAVLFETSKLPTLVHLTYRGTDLFSLKNEAEASQPFDSIIKNPLTFSATLRGRARSVTLLCRG